MKITLPSKTTLKYLLTALSTLTIGIIIPLSANFIRSGGSDSGEPSGQGSAISSPDLSGKADGATSADASQKSDNDKSSTSAGDNSQASDLAKTNPPAPAPIPSDGVNQSSSAARPTTLPNTSSSAVTPSPSVPQRPNPSVSPASPAPSVSSSQPNVVGQAPSTATLDGVQLSADQIVPIVTDSPSANPSYDPANRPLNGQVNLSDLGYLPGIGPNLKPDGLGNFTGFQVIQLD